MLYIDEYGTVLVSTRKIFCFHVESKNKLDFTNLEWFFLYIIASKIGPRWSSLYVLFASKFSIIFKFLVSTSSSGIYLNKLVSLSLEVTL